MSGTILETFAPLLRKISPPPGVRVSLNLTLHSRDFSPKAQPNRLAGSLRAVENDDVRCYVNGSYTPGADRRSASFCYI